MCVDYRRLNSVTNIDCFSLPPLDAALNAFAGSTVFSSLDLAMAYHQVAVKPSGIEHTAFITQVHPLRDAEDAFRFLQCAVDLSAVDGRSFAKTDWSHLSRLSRRCDRLLEETIGARC